MLIDGLADVLECRFAEVVNIEVDADHYPVLPEVCFVIADTEIRLRVQNDTLRARDRH